MRAILAGRLPALIAALVMGAACQTAQAIPILQLYVEGATYDTDSSEETWVVTSTTGEFRIWAIGNVAAKGTIFDVKLSIVYDTSLNPTIQLFGSTVDSSPGSPYEDVVDSTTPPDDPTWNQTVNGGSPLLGDGITNLPTHGEYGDNKTWQEFLLGNFTSTADSIADFSVDFPTTFSTGGQINVYDVLVTGLAVGDSIHFDLYNHVVASSGAKYKFAPFSHDGEGGIDDGPTTNSVPEPTSIALLATGVLGAVAAGRRRRQQAA